MKVKTPFRQCGICGARHGNSCCPVLVYNAELEARAEDVERSKVTAAQLFPGNPHLVAMLEALQLKWMGRRLHAAQ